MPAATRILSLNLGSHTVGLAEFHAQANGGLVLNGYHSAEEWVCGDVHTNTVEGVWSLFKRSVIGTYHKLSAKQLDAYLDELEHRFNNRNNEFLFRDTLLKLVKAQKWPYAELTKAA